VEEHRRSGLPPIQRIPATEHPSLLFLLGAAAARGSRGGGGTERRRNTGGRRVRSANVNAVVLALDSKVTELDPSVVELDLRKEKSIR
jgi:hypothetical protein